VNNIAVYHSPIGFKNAKAQDNLNYINYLKNIMEDVPEEERQILKELMDGDFGLLELATNAGRDVKKEQECCLLSTAFVIPRDSWVLIGFDWWQR
jgi:hypothetical protein